MAASPALEPDLEAFRMPGEWEPHEATWLGWPHNTTDWPGRFAPIPWVYGEIVRKLADGEIVRKRGIELEVLAGLRKLGVRLSLDKFGTRDVSFESLDNGFIDSFVLDQSLVSDLSENDSHQRIVKAAIAMAQGMDIEVAAGGLETVTQLEFLKNCNCDLAQGFLISRPIQPEKVSAILRSEIAGTRLLSRGMP